MSWIFSHDVFFCAIAEHHFKSSGNICTKSFPRPFPCQIDEFRQFKDARSTQHIPKKELSANDIETGMTNESLVWHASPLKQISIQLQGTRHTSRASLIKQLDAVVNRLKNGDVYGRINDDDVGYKFCVVDQTDGPSFFDDVGGGVIYP